ncbi:H-2 class II histocompatibility antigen, A-U alpha chain isoform X1 [Gasterosteus aculeatus]
MHSCVCLILFTHNRLCLCHFFLLQPEEHRKGNTPPSEKRAEEKREDDHFLFGSPGTRTPRASRIRRPLSSPMAVTLMLALAAALCTSAAGSSHDFHYTYGCYESGEVRVDVLLDGDVVAYADFGREEVVFLIPRLPPFLRDLKKLGYEFAKSSFTHCRSVLAKAKRASPNVTIPQDAPVLSVYSRHEGRGGAANTLFCLADGFYPPSVNFTWTKNGARVTGGVWDLPYGHNRDGTFHRISTLSTTPREGDVYSCSVEHRAARRPLASSWEPKEGPSRVSPAAGFFGASLVVCLIGVASGAYFFTKQPNFGFHS